MPFVDGVIARIPQPFRDIALRHSELIKFAIVGGTTFLIDSGIFYTLKLSILESKPITAKIIAGVVAVIASYILNREWSFKNRGGREPAHEAALFFIISANLLFGILLGGLPSMGIPAMGLIAAIFGITIVASLAGDDFRLKEVLALSVVLSIGSYLAFVVLLKLQFPVWPTFIAG